MDRGVPEPQDDACMRTAEDLADVLEWLLIARGAKKIAGRRRAEMQEQPPRRLT